MSTKKHTADLSMMTRLPLEPGWLILLPAFQSADGTLVRACFQMLISAFRNKPCGYLAPEPDALAASAGLGVEQFQANSKLLLSGWKKVKEGFVFEPMADLAQRLHEEYAVALRRLQDAASVAIAAPDLFGSELLDTQGAELEAQVGQATKNKATNLLEQTRVPRLLPKGIGLTAPIKEILVDRGFTADVHQEVWQMFTDVAYSKGLRSANWISEFRYWLNNKTFYGRLDPQSAAPSQQPSKGAVPTTRHTFSFGTRSGAGANPAQSRGIAAQDQANENLARARQAAQRFRENQGGSGR